MLYCFAAFLLSSGWTPMIDLAVNNSTPFITTLLSYPSAFFLSAGSPGPELVGLDITLIPPCHQQILFLFYPDTNLIGYASPPTILYGLTFSMHRIPFCPFRPLVMFSLFPSSPCDGLVSLLLFCPFFFLSHFQPGHILHLRISRFRFECTAHFLSLL